MMLSVWACRSRKHFTDTQEDEAEDATSYIVMTTVAVTFQIQILAFYLTWNETHCLTVNPQIKTLYDDNKIFS